MRLKLIPGALLDCYSSWQAAINDAFDKGYALLLDTLKGVLVQDGTPTPDQQTNQLWWQTIAGAPGYGGYIFYNGLWVLRHPMPPGAVIMWEGDITTLDTFDGGQAGAVTSTTGPFWEQVTEIAARFPIAPGTLPSGAVVNNGDTGGAETQTITAAMLPDITLNASGLGRATASNEVADPGGALLGIGSLPGTAYTGPVATLGGSGTPFDLAPPYYALWFIRRTDRLYRTAP